MTSGIGSGMGMRYERNIGRLIGLAERGVITERQYEALRAFVAAVQLRKKLQALRYPQPLAKVPQPRESFDPDSLGDGFPVGNQDPDKRGYGHSLHPDR